jgi:hypothetical protein
MTTNINPKHLSIGMGAIGLAGLLLVGGMVIFLLNFNLQGETYPGSQKLTSDEVIRLAPYLYFRQEKVYLTDDYIPYVVRWYANRFGLSPDRHGQSNCIAMFTKSVGMWITKVMRVTVCDTVSGRMIFDERTIQLK